MRRVFRRDGRSGQRGSTLVTAVAMVFIMGLLGAGALAIVNTQTIAASRDRQADRSFLLAESVLNLQIAHMGATEWPAEHRVCSRAHPVDGVCITDTTVAQAYGAAAGGLPIDATWRIALRPMDGERVEVAVAANIGETAAPRATERAVRAVVGRREVVALPVGYGVIAGGMDGELANVLNQVGSGGLLGQLTNAEPLIDGTIGLRCGLLSENACLQGALDALGPGGVAQGGLVGATSNLLGLDNYRRFQADTAARDDVMAALLRDAVPGGPDQSCLEGTSPEDVVYVANRDCVLNLSAGTTRRRALIVENGRITIRGPESSGLAVFRGVVWATDPPTDGAPIVTIEGRARVVGAVAVDGDGEISLNPPGNSTELGGLVGQITGLQNQQADVANELDNKRAERDQILATLGAQLTPQDIAELAALEQQIQTAEDAARAASTTSYANYPKLSCPLLTGGLNHEPLKAALLALRDRIGAYRIRLGQTGLSGTTEVQSAIAALAAEESRLLAQANGLQSECVLLGGLVGGLSALLAQVLGGVTNLLDGLLAPVLGAVDQLVSDLAGQVDGLTAQLNVLGVQIPQLEGTLTSITGQLANLDQTVNGLLGTLLLDGGGLPPMVRYDQEVVTALTARGGSGMVADSFRQVPPGAVPTP